MLIVATMAAYQPAWQGGWVWGDQNRITEIGSRTFGQLVSSWFDMTTPAAAGALVSSIFWVEYGLWGDNTLGYHLLSITLHAAAAVLAMQVLRHLEIPGAWLAAGIFALHPLQVQSVAWISALECPLSAVCYLAAMLCYLRFASAASRWAYALALTLYCLAVATNLTAATLPAALLMIAWWQRGRWSWRTDLLPLVPMIIVGVCAGLLAAWRANSIAEAPRADVDLNFLERLIVAGRAVWFYVGKLLWPSNLAFDYPRWSVDGVIGWQSLFLLAAIAVLSVAWALRERSRAPLAALLLFVTTLLPNLGIMRFHPAGDAQVADHFQYLAGLSLIALFAAAAARLGERYGSARPLARRAACLLLLAMLGGLTWRQSRAYAEIESLYRATLQQNPESWMAYDKLGSLLAGQGDNDAAMENYQQAILLHPDFAEAHFNLGVSLNRAGHAERAISEFRRALSISPGYVLAYNNLGLALLNQGQVAQAIETFSKALQAQPDNAETCSNLANAYSAQGKLEEAIIQYQKAVDLRPGFAVAHNNLATALIAQGRLDLAIDECEAAIAANPEFAAAYYNLGNIYFGKQDFRQAIANFEAAIAIDPDYAVAHNNLANALLEQRRYDAAISHYQRALELQPTLVEASFNLGVLYIQQGRASLGADQWRAAIKLRPDNVVLLSRLAWLLATSADASVRNADEASELANRAVQQSGGRDAAALDALAAASALAEEFGLAVQYGKQALAVAEAQADAPMAAALRERLNLYRQNQPYRQPQ